MRLLDICFQEIVRCDLELNASNNILSFIRHSQRNYFKKINLMNHKQARLAFNVDMLKR